MEEQDIITVPADIGELGTNVPWIVRSGGHNLWDEVQFRDPSPDHLREEIPGLRFDAEMRKRISDPIRGGVYSGTRAGLDTAIPASLANDRPG